MRGSNERVVIEIMAALQMSFFVTVPAIVLLLKILERRCEQVRAMNIARLLHHDLVMHTISL